MVRSCRVLKSDSGRNGLVCKRARVIGKAVAVLLALYAVNYLLTPRIVGPHRLEVWFRPKGAAQFDRAVWASRLGTSGRRYEMVDDLLKTYLRPGLTREQVEDLLGKPDGAEEKEGEVCVYYSLARQRDYPARSILFPGRFWNWEVWVLRIRFREGRVYEANVIFA